jgi:hypothetical protein
VIGYWTVAAVALAALLGYMTAEVMGMWALIVTLPAAVILGAMGARADRYTADRSWS